MVLIGSTLLIAFVLIASITIFGVKDSNKKMLQGLEFELQAENVRIAVNQALTSGPLKFGAGDEIAFLPPVTGG